MRPRNARPTTRGPQSAYRPAERAEGGLCALRAAPNPMSEREHELHRRMTSLTERHRAWPRSWARTERAVPRDPFAGGVGSSPHTRGAPGCVTRDARRNRDHPRIRGEHFAGRRGRPRSVGIIPAYAGSTIEGIDATSKFLGSSPHTRGARPWKMRPRRTVRDHPRIRGEHLPRRFRVNLIAGIIPAYAENTPSATTYPQSTTGSSPHTRGTRTGASCSRTCPRDHPRIRGEHLARSAMYISVAGIIPAYAGNTQNVSKAKDDPTGSSPHTRGTRA